MDAVTRERGEEVSAGGKMFLLLLSDRVYSGISVLQQVGSGKAMAVAERDQVMRWGKEEAL